MMLIVFFFSSRRRHTRYWRDWSSDVCSSDLLVKSGAIWTVQPKGTSRGRAIKKRSVWKVHGKGPGSKKGKKTARVGKKEVYVVRTRSMRHHLKVIKERKDISNDAYWQLYKKVNGGQVRSLAHLRELAKEAKSG